MKTLEQSKAALLTLMILAIMLTCVISCRHEAVQGEKDMLFELWKEDTTEKCKNLDIISPNKKFTAIVSRIMDKNEDRVKLQIVNNNSQTNRVIARGFRGIGVSWYSTQIGDVAVIEHAYDTHVNEIYVIAPIGLANGNISWNLLYKTPNTDNCTVNRVVDHSYWRVKTISANGIMTINGYWDYIDTKICNADGGEDFKIPLFYGIMQNMKKDLQGTGKK